MRTIFRRWAIPILVGGLWFYTVWHYIHGAFLYRGYGDFFLLLDAVRQWVREGQFISEEVFLYPPFFYLLSAPFAWMSNGVAVGVMLVLNQFLLGICLVLLAMAILPRPTKGLWMWLFLPLALNFRPLLLTLSMAKIELLQVTLLLGSLIAFQRHRPWITGGLVAVAGMVKPLPLPLILYFAWKREFLVVKAWGLTVLAILALCCPFIGTHSVWTYVVNLVGAGTGNPVSWYEDQSLRGVASRIFQLPLPDHYYYPSLDKSFLATALRWILRLGVLGWLGWLTRPRRGVSSNCLAGEWSVGMAGMLLLSPFSRDYYAVFLFPAYLFLAHDLWNQKVPLCSPALWIGITSYLLVGQGFPLGIIGHLPQLIKGVDNFHVYLHYGIPTVGYLLLVAAWALVLRDRLPTVPPVSAQMDRSVLVGS